MTEEYSFLPEKHAYTYTYANSLTGKVFYVGKGVDDRYLYHFWQAQRSSIEKPTRVVVAIRTIWQRGGKVIIRKVHPDVPDGKAIKLERELIQHYGYDQLVNLPHYKTWRWDLVKDVDEVLKIESEL